jgi:hypothetical protein
VSAILENQTKLLPRSRRRTRRRRKRRRKRRRRRHKFSKVLSVVSTCTRSLTYEAPLKERRLR